MREGPRISFHRHAPIVFNIKLISSTDKHMRYEMWAASRCIRVPVNVHTYVRRKGCDCASSGGNGVQTARLGKGHIHELFWACTQMLVHKYISRTQFVSADSSWPPICTALKRSILGLRRLQQNEHVSVGASSSYTKCDGKKRKSGLIFLFDPCQLLLSGASRANTHSFPLSHTSQFTV